MVAMFGLIMPAPLLIPVIVTLWLPTCNVTDAALGCVSVVIMDSAAKNQLSSLRLAIACGNPATKRSTGKGSKITPVENGKICEASQPSNSASAAQVALAAANPASPVHLYDSLCEYLPQHSQDEYRQLVLNQQRQGVGN